LKLRLDKIQTIIQLIQDSTMNYLRVWIVDSSLEKQNLKTQTLAFQD